MRVGADTRTVSLPRLLAVQIRAVLLGYWRIPLFALFTIGLPVMFFAFFGLPRLHQEITHHESVGAYILASLGAYAVSNVLVYNVGIGQAQTRARKLDLLQRASPLPGWIAIAATLVGGLVLATSALVVLLLVGALAGVSLPPTHWLLLVVALLYGAIPMLGLGLTIGYLGSSGNLAPALASLIYLPMAFASGILIPLTQLPALVTSIAPYLPLYQVGQLGWNAVGAANESALQAVFWTAVWGLVLGGLAVYAYGRDQGRKFA
ncbi:MAG TPA: ABC transporter permease [Candidatus Acidoferrales bacterium]|nr:ABC transporter permease [Candidatus Acidoferrales bacterium]